MTDKTENKSESTRVMITLPNKLLEELDENLRDSGLGLSRSNKIAIALAHELEQEKKGI